MEVFFVLYGIISIILLIVFLVMAANIGAIKTEIKKTNLILREFQKATGYGVNYKCQECSEMFTGKLENCPNCGKVNNWPK